MAKICVDYSTDGYSDWYFPSKDEMYKLYQNMTVIGGWGSTTDTYSTSSEVDKNSVWLLPLRNGNWDSVNTKSNAYRIRAVRAF